jgi:acetoacetyl-CoA synthetase
MIYEWVLYTINLFKLFISLNGDGFFFAFMPIILGTLPKNLRTAPMIKKALTMLFLPFILNSQNINDDVNQNLKHLDYCDSYKSISFTQRMMTNKNALLWQPTQEQILKSNLYKFMSFLHTHKIVDKKHTNYDELYDWSISQPISFWHSLTQFCNVIGEFPEPNILDHAENMEKSVFFPHARLNFAENLLKRQDDAPAIMFYSEHTSNEPRVLTFKQLYDEVSKLSQQLKEWGVRPGDRVAGYLPNIPEAIISMLATSTLGAIWSSCSQDFGVSGLVDRFSQIEPKVFITTDGYYYGGKGYSCLDKIPEIIKSIPSIQHTILIPYLDPNAKHDHTWDKTVNTFKPHPIFFEKFPFNHPLYILYSSGTTGVPKCIIHRAGGVLLQHLKEHQLHSDIKKDDRVFYFTTCGWMMWNWLASVLSSEATVILYDGSPVHPDPDILFKIAEHTKMTFMGVSAKYIDSIHKLNLNPMKTHDLSHLRTIGSTGSPLLPESFNYVYESIKKDVCLSSLSGGTDIVSCFVLGNPMGAVHRGEIQARGLGMKVEVYGDDGKPLPHGQKGELVCTLPFPSQPLGFWNDPDGSRYHNAYFARFDKIWHHGDFVEITENTHGLVIHGRSDAVLNPGGVRIGTAEIYRQLKDFNELLDYVTIGQEWDGDIRIVLFVKLKPGFELNDDLIQRIKKKIRTEETPRHVPAKIIAVSDIPRTRNHKISEIAVRQVVHNELVKNTGSLENPESLEHFKNLGELCH